MKRVIPFLLVIMVMLSCKKNSESDFIWEKTYGEGSAYFIKSSSDSGFYACGESAGNPIFVRFDKNRSVVIEIKAEIRGLFSSAWFDTSGYITGGNTDGKMLLMRYSKNGNLLWEKYFDAGFYIDFTEVLYTGHGNFLALASASPDSAKSGATGLIFVRFDTTGQIITQKKISDANFISASSAVLDDMGNIYMAVTRKTSYAMPKASVAMYNDLFQKIWETDLYNNPDFGANSLAVLLDDRKNVYVAGRTGVAAEGGIIDNSFVASLTNSGILNWKMYLESSNSGSSLFLDDSKSLNTLNKNCFVIRKNNPDNGADEGIIRPFSECVSEDTDAFAEDFCVNYDKNILFAGSKGGLFYLALKSSVE
jgi:hypothetical protein